MIMVSNNLNTYCMKNVSPQTPKPRSFFFFEGYQGNTKILPRYLWESQHNSLFDVLYSESFAYLQNNIKNDEKCCMLFSSLNRRYSLSNRVQNKYLSGRRLFKLQAKISLHDVQKEKLMFHRI